LCSNSVRMEDMLPIEDIVRINKLSHFWPILKLTCLILWILTRWLLEGVHFQPFQVHEMELNWKVRYKVKHWNTNFHKWKGIWIYKEFLNYIAFIVFQCCSITFCSNITICAVIWCMAIIKTKATNILCLHPFIMCIESFLKKFKFKKNLKKKHRRLT
jgi:hypothetical protein